MKRDLPPVIVVAGVAGSGKSTVGAKLAQRLGADFLDADVLHAPGSIEKMRAGIPLTDADRSPWLARVATHIHEALAAHRPLVVACSALKKAYRQALDPSEDPRVRIVMLDGSPALLQARLAARTGHFLAPTLLPDQMHTYEAPAPDEKILVVSIAEEPDEIVDHIIRELARDTRQGHGLPS